MNKNTTLIARATETTNKANIYIPTNAEVAIDNIAKSTAKTIFNIIEFLLEFNSRFKLPHSAINPSRLHSGQMPLWSEYAEQFIHIALPHCLQTDIASSLI